MCIDVDRPTLKLRPLVRLCHRSRLSPKNILNCGIKLSLQATYAGHIDIRSNIGKETALENVLLSLGCVDIEEKERICYVASKWCTMSNDYDLRIVLFASSD
jgi:hypothetical protein